MKRFFIFCLGLAATPSPATTFTDPDTEIDTNFTDAPVEGPGTGTVTVQWTNPAPKRFLRIKADQP